MALYKTRHGDSPSIIARRLGVSREALLRANAHKPTAVVRGQTTWHSLVAGEGLIAPPGSGTVGMAGALGDAQIAAAAIGALVAAGGPCLQANAGFVCAVQAALGLTMDGKWGNDTSSAARRIVPSAPGACSPAPLWWGRRGESKCPTTIPSFPSAMPALPPSFAPAPPPPVPLPIMQPIPIATAPVAATAIQALATGIDPCLQVNAPMICAAQAALGLTVDGKYGAGTASAVRALVPGAPPACSPAPLWWGKRGESKCGGIAPQPLPVMPVAPPPMAPAPIPVVAPVAPPPVVYPVAPAPMPALPVVVAPSPVAPPMPSAPVAPGGEVVVVSPTQPGVVAPEKGKLSTGAIVAGAVGVAALVGLVALAASGKSRSSTTTKTTTVRRAAPRRKTKRKPAKRKTASRKKR